MKTEPMRVLDECAETMAKKGRDYQNPHSIVRQADYYPNGCMTILDIIHAKTLRMRSVLEAMTNDSSYAPNFESIEDSAKDLINYAAFFVAYSRGKIDGQDPNRDMLNRTKSEVPLADQSVGYLTMSPYPIETSVVKASDTVFTLPLIPRNGMQSALDGQDPNRDMLNRQKPDVSLSDLSMSSSAYPEGTSDVYSKDSIATASLVFRNDDGTLRGDPHRDGSWGTYTYDPSMKQWTWNPDQ